MKYTFAATNRFGEVLRVDGADSFDEAIAKVEKGLYERDLQVGTRLVDAGKVGEIPDDIKLLLVEAGKLHVHDETTPTPGAVTSPPQEPQPAPTPAAAPAAPAAAPEAPQAAPSASQAPSSPAPAPAAPAAPQA